MLHILLTFIVGLCMLAATVVILHLIGVLIKKVWAIHSQHSFDTIDDAPSILVAFMFFIL